MDSFMASLTRILIAVAIIAHPILDCVWQREHLLGSVQVPICPGAIQSSAGHAHAPAHAGHAHGCAQHDHSVAAQPSAVADDCDSVVPRETEGNCEAEGKLVTDTDSGHRHSPPGSCEQHSSSFLVVQPVASPVPLLSGLASWLSISLEEENSCVASLLACECDTGPPALPLGRHLWFSTLLI